MMENRTKFTVKYLREAVEFLQSLDEKAREKIAYNIGKAMLVVDKDLFKKLGDTDIWEFRTLHRGTAYRLFAFWDTAAETLVVATHGIAKKTQKTPPREIAKAEAIRQRYFDAKKTETQKASDMETIGTMELYSHDEMLDQVVGRPGTHARERYERKMDEFLIGEAIKRTREAQHLTQEQLGERMGVKRAQVSRIESGRSLTYSTIVRAFKALGVRTASLDLGAAGKVALW